MHLIIFLGSSPFLLIHAEVGPRGSIPEQVCPCASTLRVWTGLNCLLVMSTTRDHYLLGDHFAEVMTLFNLPIAQ